MTYPFACQPVTENSPENWFVERDRFLSDPGKQRKGKKASVCEKEMDFSKMAVAIAAPNDREIPSDSLESKTPVLVRLDFERLRRFEVVDRQFSAWGVAIANAIALQPSNPAFPPHSGRMLLMSAPKNGTIEISFQKPVRFVSGFVTGSRRTVLSAYDRAGNFLAQTQIPGGNLAGRKGAIGPNANLRLSVANISRLTFCAFEGQITLDDFSFCH